MTAAADPIFLDTNILVYASVDASPFYQAARAAITAMKRAKCRCGSVAKSCANIWPC